MKSLLEKLFFALIFAAITTAITRVLSGGESSDMGGVHQSNPVLLFFNTLVVAGTLYYAYPRLPRIWRAVLRLRWVFLLYLWMTASVLWSVDRAATVRPVAYSLIYLLAAAYFAFRYDTNELLNLLSRCCLAIALLSVGGEFILPPTDDPAPGWSGVFMQKNTMGLVMMIAIAVLLVRRKRWSLAQIAILALYLGLLALSQSFTAILATAVITLFILVQRMASTMKAVLWTCLAGTLCLLFIVTNPILLLLSASGKNTSFTGRDVIWGFALKGIAEHPLLGHGYYAFWADASGSAEQALNWNPHHAHNGLLEVALDLGLVGVVLSLCFLVNAAKRARRLHRIDRSVAAPWLLVLLVMTVMHNLMESDLMSISVLWFLVMMASFSCLRREDEVRSSGLAHEQESASEMLTV